jgi:hypothetical protein
VRYKGQVFAWFASLRIGLLEWSKEPVPLIVWAMEREVVRVGLGEVDGVTADDNEVFEAAVVGPWNHVVRMDKVWVTCGLDRTFRFLVRPSRI